MAAAARDLARRATTRSPYAGGTEAPGVPRSRHRAAEHRGEHTPDVVGGCLLEGGGEAPRSDGRVGHDQLHPVPAAKFLRDHRQRCVVQLEDSTRPRQLGVRDDTALDSHPLPGDLGPVARVEQRRCVGGALRCRDVDRAGRDGNTRTVGGIAADGEGRADVAQRRVGRSYDEGACVVVHDVEERLALEPDLARLSAESVVEGETALGAEHDRRSVREPQRVDLPDPGRMDDGCGNAPAGRRRRLTRAATAPDDAQSGNDHHHRGSPERHGPPLRLRPGTPRSTASGKRNDVRGGCGRVIGRTIAPRHDRGERGFDLARRERRLVVAEQRALEGAHEGSAVGVGRELGADGPLLLGRALAGQKAGKALPLLVEIPLLAVVRHAAVTPEPKDTLRTRPQTRAARAGSSGG
jgi:hypothetical protein